MKPALASSFSAVLSVLASCSGGETANGRAHQAAATNGDGNDQLDVGDSDSSDDSGGAFAEQSAGDSRDTASPEAPSHSTETHQTAEEALASDLATIAEGKGWSVEEAEAHHAGTEAVGDAAAEIAAARPDILVGSAVGPGPYDPPRLYIKGPADAFVLSVVQAAPVTILIIDEQPYSRAELDERTQLLAGELQALGFTNFAVGADIQQEGLLEATVQRAAGAPQTEDELIGRLPESIRSDVHVTFSDEPVFHLD